MTKIYKAAIIGSGDIASSFDSPESKDVLTHAHAYSLHPGFALCGFVDPDFSKAIIAAKKWGGRAYQTVEYLLKSERPEIVSVCSPDETHSKVVGQLEGKDILGGIIEKPLAANLNDARYIAKSPLVKDGKFLVNYSRLFVPEFQKLKQDYLKGNYGRLISVSGYYGKGLIHNGSHMISLLNWLFGNIKIVKKLSSIKDFTENDQSISAVLEFPAGVTGVLYVIDSRLYTIFELDLLFERSRVRMIDSGHKLEVYKLDKSKKYFGYTMMNPKEVIATSLGRSLFFAVDNLYHWLGGNQSPIFSVDDALTVQKICEDVTQSK